MERPYWRNEEVLAEIKGLNFTQVIDFGVDQLIQGSGTTLLCFTHGNVNETQVINMPMHVYNIVCFTAIYFIVQTHQYTMSMANSRFGLGLLKSQIFSQPFGHYWQQRVHLSEPGNYSVVIPTLNPEDHNSVVNVIFQVYHVHMYRLLY